VILLENSNAWNFSPAKEGSSKKEKKEEKKKKGEQGLKSKRGETSYKEAPYFKRRKEKKRIKFTSCWERIYQKKETKEITFSYIAKSDVWAHPYSHIICNCTTFYSLTFPFLTPFHYIILHQS
jgi:hypothetical protein